MTFFSLVPPLVAVVVLLWGLGGCLSWSVGLRGYWAMAAAPAFAVTLVAGTAVVASWTRVPWSVLPVAVLTAVVATAIRLIRGATSRASAPPPRRRPAVGLLAAVAVASLVVAWRVLEIVQAPGNISQTFDNVFHLNGIRFILVEGDASSLHLGYMTSPDGSLPFYPAAWHALAALVVQLTGVSIPVAVNALTLVVSALVWPMSAVLLVRTLFGRYLPFTVAAAFLAASVPAFPILLLDYGVLYPLQLSFALLPVAVSATVRLLRTGVPVAPHASPWWVLILVGIVPGLTLAHPGGFVGWLALTAPVAVIYIVQRLRAATSRRRRLGVAVAAVGYLAVGALLVRVLRPPVEARGWPPQMSLLEAAGQALTLSMWYGVPAIAAALSAAAGVVWVLIDRTPRALAALGLYAVGAGLFIVVAALPWSALRDALTGSWYNNLPRLAALFVVALIPLAAYGAGRTCFALRSARPVRSMSSSKGQRVIVASAASLAFLGLLQASGSVGRAVEWAAPLYRLDADSPLLTADEYALLQRLPTEVPAGVTVAGSPWTGASLAFAISDRPVLMPHTLMYVSDDLEAINNGLDGAERGDAVCAALTRLDVGYVLDFGPQEVHLGEHDYPGLDDLATSSAVHLVDREGTARLYRITACR